METDPKNRRMSPRSSYRTVVTVLQPDVQDETGATLAIKGWSDDISSTGVRLLCEKELQHSRVWLRFLLPGGVEYCLEGTVLRNHEQPHGDFRPKTSFVHHAVRFEKLVTPDDFNRLMIERIPQPSLPEATERVAPPGSKLRSLWTKMTNH